MRYEKARAEVVLFENGDIVTASPGSEPVKCNGGKTQVKYCQKASNSYVPSNALDLLDSFFGSDIAEYES